MLDQNQVTENTNQANSTLNTVAREVFSSISSGIFISYTTFPMEGYKKCVVETGKSFPQAIMDQKKIDKTNSTAQVLKRIMTTGQVKYFDQNQQIKSHKFYRGSLVFAASIVPTTMIQLLGNAYLKNTLLTDNANNAIYRIAASIGCGVLGAITGTFVENCIVRQQVMSKELGKHVGPVEAIKDSLQHRGLSGLWKSYPLIATRDGIFTSSMLWLTPAACAYARENWGDNYVLPTRIAVNVLGAVASHPFDTMATRMQMTHQKMSMVDAARDVTQNLGGLKGFYKGLPYRIGLFTAFSNFIPPVKEKAEKIYDSNFSHFFVGMKKQPDNKEKAEVVLEQANSVSSLASPRA